MHTHGEVVRGVKIFSNLSDIEISFIVINLMNVIYMPADIIIRQGEEATSMFFITKGKVEIEIMRYILDEDYLKLCTKKSQTEFQPRMLQT